MQVNDKVHMSVTGMLLVDTQMKTLRRPAALSDFLHCQDGHLGDVVDALRSDWLLKVETFSCTDKFCTGINCHESKHCVFLPASMFAMSVNQSIASKHPVTSHGWCSLTALPVNLCEP